MRFINENNKFLKDLLYHQQFVLKLAAKEELVQRVFAQNPDSISWLVNFILDFELPNFNSASMVTPAFSELKPRRSRATVCASTASRSPRVRPGRARALTSLLTAFQDYRSFCNEKIARIKKLMHGEHELTPETWDSDDDLLESEFAEGDKLDF